MNHHLIAPVRLIVLTLLCAMLCIPAMAQMETDTPPPPDTTQTTPENSTGVQNSDDSAYLATLERLTNLLVIIVTGGAVVGTGALGLTLRTLIQLAKTLAALTPSTVDDEFIKRVVDKIEGRK